MLMKKREDKYDYRADSAFLTTEFCRKSRNKNRVGEPIENIIEKKGLSKYRMRCSF